MQSSTSLRKKLIRLALSYPHEPGVMALTMFFDQYLPLAVRVSNCMEQAKSSSLEVLQNSFNAMNQVFLPAMAQAFHTLKSLVYR
jgi:hypothetical protein